jgi:DNA modification methylase
MPAQTKRKKSGETVNAKSAGPTVKAGRISDLRPDGHNANRGTERGAGMLEESLRAYGAGRSLLVDKHGVVIAGNKTLDAAASVGLDDVVVVQTDGTKLVVVQRTDLDLARDPKAQALGVADNRVAEIGLAWDASVLQDIAASGADMSAMFTAQELAELVTDQLQPAEGLTDADSVPNERETDIVIGDAFKLGAHRIMCGDSTNPQHVDALLDGAKPHLMVTDPPYGVEYDPKWRSDAGVNKNRQKMGKVMNDDRADWSDAWTLFHGDVAYVWHDALRSGLVQESLERCGFKMRSQIVWAKERFALSRGHYHWQHEPCWYAVKDSGHWIGDRSQSTLWKINSREGAGLGHGTQKPVECMRRPIENNSMAGDAVYEPFSGSGTTIIAAEQSGRRCYAMELNPSYVQIAIDRWEQFTGQKAERVTA